MGKNLKEIQVIPVELIQATDYRMKYATNTNIRKATSLLVRPRVAIVNWQRTTAKGGHRKNSQSVSALLPFGFFEQPNNTRVAGPSDC
jgi:hypothetical protein